MKIKNYLCIASIMSIGLGAALADDHKHPDDKCPKGTHEVVKETKTSVGGKAEVGGGVNIGVGKAEGSVGGHVEKTITEREKVCRDNKDTNVKQSKELLTNHLMATRGRERVGGSEY